MNLCNAPEQTQGFAPVFFMLVYFFIFSETKAYSIPLYPVKAFQDDSRTKGGRSCWKMRKS